MDATVEQVDARRRPSAATALHLFLHGLACAEGPEMSSAPLGQLHKASVFCSNRDRGARVSTILRHWALIAGDCEGDTKVRFMEALGSVGVACEQISSWVLKVGSLVLCQFRTSSAKLALAQS